VAILRRAAAILTVVGVLASAEVGARAAPSARLVYVRGPGAERCPSEAAVRAAVSARLGYDPFLDWAGETMFVEIQRGPRAFRVLVKLVGADNLQRGAREIAVRGDDCSAVIDAMGLSISLAIDAGAGSRRDVPASPPKPEQPPPAPAPPQPVPSATPAVIVPAAPRASAAAKPAALALRMGAGVLGTLNGAPSSTAASARR
jgi:pyruvate/2-oxoglutarate dehydrogenase complex dihydrolipoamide acyltransferase (E2) component